MVEEATQAAPAEGAVGPQVEAVPGAEADEAGAGESTYVYQLRAFAASIASGEPVPTSAPSALVTMRLIDDAYRAAGLAPRPADGQG